MAQGNAAQLAIAPDAPSVLIVERDPHVRDLQEHFLRRAGYTVEFVDDGLTALARAKATNPTVVITEILVPKLDGLTLCRQLAEDPATAQIPVVVFSILSAGVRAQEAGAKAFVRKPFVESFFMPAIEDAIAASQSMEQR